MARLSSIGLRVPPLACRLSRPERVTEPFYSSPEWRALVRELIAIRGYRCEDPLCKTANRGADRQIYGDHIRELKVFGAPLDPANIMLRYAACHGRKTEP